MLNNRYVLLGLLLLLSVINQIDRQMLVSFSADITADLQLSNAQFGLLNGAFFAIFYSLGGVVMGALADRYNRPRLIAAGLFIWSAMTAITGLGRTFLQMSAARMLVSVGEASLTPAATTLLGDRFPAEHRGAAIGLFFMGIPLGLGGSFLVASQLGPLLGWRGSFWLLGGIGLLFTALVLMVKEPRLELSAAGETGGSGAEEGVASIREIPSLMLHALKTNAALRYTIAGFVSINLFYAGYFFTQLWLIRERGFDGVDIGQTYGLILISAGIAGALAGGALSDWYDQRFKGGRAAFIVIVAILLAPLMLSFRTLDPVSPLFYVGMGSGFLLINLVYGPFFTLLQEVSPPDLRGTVVGFTMLSINVFALGVGGFLVGFVSDSLGAAGSEAPLTPVLFAADLASLLCIPCCLMVMRRTVPGD